MNNLLSKYIRMSLSQEEMKDFKLWLYSASDDELEGVLYNEWMNYETETILKKNVNTKVVKRDSVIRLNYLPLYLKRVIGAVAILLVLFALASSVYYTTKKQTYETFAESVYKIRTGKGEKATLLLPDGSSITLNSETTFSYPATFNKSDRNVNLEGEAFFEIVQNQDLPFIVHAKETSIKVLGTKFNVHAYSYENWVETSLVEGKVSFYESSNPANNVLLTKDQTARFNAYTNKFDHDITEQLIATAWQRNEIVFQSASWTYTIEQISRRYGTLIEYDTLNAPAKLFTGSFVHENLDVVLENLKVHYKFTYTKSRDSIFIKFN